MTANPEMIEEIPSPPVDTPPVEAGIQPVQRYQLPSSSLMPKSNIVKLAPLKNFAGLLMSWEREQW